MYPSEPARPRLGDLRIVQESADLAIDDYWRFGCYTRKFYCSFPDKTREQMRYVYHWLFGSVALLVITVGVLLMCYRKHRARKRARYDENLLVEIKEISQNIDNNGKQLTKSESGNFSSQISKPI